MVDIFSWSWIMCHNIHYFDQKNMQLVNNFMRHYRLCNICKTYQLALFCNKTSCFHFITFHYFFSEFVKRWAYLGHYSQTCDYVRNTIFAVVFEICSRKNWCGIIQRCPKHSIINGLQILACESWIEQIDQCNSIYNFELFGSKPKSPRWVHWNFGIESGGWW